MSDRIKTLYGQLVRNGYDLGGYEKFNAAMHDSNRRRSLYNQLVANRADLGGYEKFSSVVETAPRTQTTTPKKRDVVADTINMLRTPSSQYTRPQPSKAAGTFEMPSKYDIYHNLPDAIKRHQTPTPLKPEAVMPSVPSNAAESVWAAADKAESADVREKVDEGWSWRKIMQALSSGASVTGGLGDDNAQALETTSVAHLKTHDLQKLSDQAWAALGSKQQQSIIDDTYRYLKEQYPDADDKALVDAARKMARAKSDEQMYNLAVEKNMPKSVGEFFLRKAAAASSFGSLSKGYASMMAGTRGDMEAEDTALHKYGSKHKVADIAGSVAGFAVDPLTYASGAVGGAATKLALWTGGKVLSEAAARKIAQTLGGKLLLGAVSGAANFGTFEAGGEALNQYKWGGTLDVDPETGRYVVGDFSVGKIASQMGHGLTMGGLTGAFGTWLGNVSTKAAQATSSTLGKLGVRTGELGVGLVGEGTIFATPEFISTYGEYNDVIKSVSDKNSPNYIADDKERSKYIAEIKAQRGERMMDIWQDNLAMIAGFKAQHALKSAGRTISELAASRRGKVGFVERMGRMLDGHPSLALSKEEQTELDKHGYGDLTQMVKEYKAYAQKDGDLPYNKITQLLNDKNVSEAARAKMYYYVTGHSLPMSAVIASNVIDNGDKTYTVQSLGDNGVITSRTYGSLKRADYEKARIDRQAELNGVAMAEQMFDNIDKAERLKAVCTRLAQDKGVSPETLLWLTLKDPKQMTAAEKRWVKEIEDAANEDAPQGENATMRHIKGVIFDEYGVDVDKALRKAADSRTEAEKSAISAYNNELAQAVAERKNAISQGETTDAYKRGYEADTQGMRDAYVAQMYEPSEDNAETLKGVEAQITESAKYQAALERDELKQMTHRDGSTHLATLKEKDKDGNGKQVYIVDGDIVMKEDGSGIDADASSKSVIIYDPATGEKKMVSPTAVDGIESLGEVKTAEQREAEINAQMQDAIQRSKDWLEGNVADPVGMQIQLGDGRIATIEAMHEDGSSAIATLPDGTQFLVSKDVLQRIVNNGHYADYKARRDAEASKRDAEQSTESAPETATEGGQPLPEEVAPKEEERREYAQGDEFDVVVDGQKMHAEIVSPKDADGRFVVNVDDGESMRTLYVTPEELAAMEYREEPSPKVEETRLATEDSSEKALERGAQPTEEHTPTALERIPRDEKGNAQFHDVDTETAWDGLVEMSGNEETAHKVAEASLANAEKKLKAAKALKEKGETPEELLQSIKENEKAVAEAEREVAAWKAIVGEKTRREEAAKAEAERIATEKAEAERKAAEERERAEKEEKARIEAEKKEAERIAAEKTEEEARVEAERKAEEERKTKEEERKERDENGQPFVVSSDGTTTFGEITEDTGLTAAPIKLSEGVADKKGNGYGLRHIEARHGDQIRKAGFSSVEEFVKYVASNYDKHNIKIGKKRANGVETYLIQAEDEHSNMLYVELSKDGSYWNVNSGGIFRKGYAEKKKDVGQNTEHPTSATTLQDKSFVQTDKDNGSQSADTHSDKQHPSADKGTTLPADQQTSDEENTKKVADSEGENTLKAKIEAASADVNTEPTEAQKKAGNYKKGHVQVGTFDITIEQPEGSIRRGTDANGKQWESKMHNTYGYFRGTEGVDGDHIDVFLSNDIDGWNGRKVFVVDQYNPDGTFDEHKVMLGFNDMDEAKSDYLANYEKGWENGRRITVSTTNLEDFEKWIDSSHRKTKPFSEYSSVNKGSEKAEKKQKKQSVFDKAKEIADKEEKKRKAEAEDDSVLGQATRAVGKKKKVNRFKYTASEKNSNLTLRGVHYANGYAYASDGYILFKEKADYPKEWEGTTRDKDGNLIDGKYPDTEKAIHRLVHIPDKEVESLPSKEVLDFAIAASKKLKGEAIPVAIDGIFFNAVNLKKFLEAVASKGMDKVVYRHPMLYATNGKDEIVMMPTVNTLEGALDIADKMESAGLPKEQIDAWKAHIEAADKKKSFDDFKKAVENAKKEGVRPTEADKQESKAEADKTKQKPLTEAERKDAEEVAGALGYRVEWVDTMEENGTIDADKKVIRIAKDAENPLVQVLGHEVAHGVRRMIGGKFRALQKAAMEVVGEKEWNERIEKKRKLNAYAEGKLAEEVTCDIVGEALNDKDALKRLAESLRGEKGILARLRDAVARMVEYFKNRGDKEGVRRMKAADKLLAEFESALKEGVAPEQVKPEGVDRSEREGKKDDKTLYGVHNISEEKLRKALKLGGLANPSVAVIDISKNSHEGFGEISLILPSEKVAKRTGKNAGTWQGDAWTPTYPQIERRMSNKGAEKASKDVLSVPSDMYSKVRIGLDRWLDSGEANSAMAYMFLHEKGVAPEPKKIQPKFSDEAYNELKSITAGNFNIYGISKADAQKVLAMYIDAYFDGDKDLYEDKTKAWLEKNRSIVDAGDKGGMRYAIAKENVKLYDEYGFNYRGVQTFVRDVEYDHRNTGVDMNATLNEVEDYIKTNSLTDEFNTWQEGKEKEYGIKEVIFDGFTPSGNRRYIPNTLENVSKIMKKQGRNGATGAWASFPNFAARLMPSYGTLEDIRSKKGLLTSDREKIDDFREMWSKVFFELGMKCQPDATGTFDDYGFDRLSEAAMTSDPQAFLKQEYNVDFSDEDTKRLKKMVKAIKEEYPAMYFETKFERPVMLNEFAAAVVPKGIGDDVRKGLEDAGLVLYEYDPAKKGDRERAANEASASDGIRFNRSEKTELTEEERELRDNLVERMRKGGLDVVTDSEEMQRVIDTENERTRMMGAGSVREHRVYHGSGADFDAFDHSHMGEGEGAQAYGWGTYVTEVEGIGRTYAIQNTTKHNDALRALQHDVDAISDQLNRHRDDLKYDEEQLKRANEWRAEAELDYELFKDEAEELKEKYGESSPKYRNHLFNDIYTDEMKRAQSSVKSTEESIQYRKEKISELEKALKDKQAEIDELPKEFPRHLYTVEIPDDNGSNYLDWNGHPAESLLKDVGSFLESNGFERVQDSPVRYEKGESTVVLNPNATGADLYAELQEALGNDKKASQALAESGCIGIKYPADNMRGGREDGAKNYVIFNENDAKITDHTRFLRTADGEVYGLVKDGRIYLDPKVATAETAVHEYTHLWGDMLRRKDSEQWNHTVKELKNSVLWEEVKELYPELKTDDEIADEVLSTFSGRRGAERLREEARRVADGDGGVFTKAKAIETLERVKEAIARFWEGVARMFGINRYRSVEELADMAMKDLLDSKNPMKDESGMRKRGEVGDEGVKSLKGEEAMVALDNIFEDKKTENMPQKVSSLVKFMELFRKPVRTFLGEVVNVKEEVYNKIIREKRTSISGAVLPTLENADFAIRDTDGSTLYIKRFKSENNDNVYNIAVVNKYGEVEDYVSSVHIKSDNNLRNKITKGAELLLPQERITDGILPRNNPTPTANVTNISEPSKPRFSRKPGESIFDYASRVSEDVDRSVRERVSARDEYEKKVKSKGFQTKEALQNSMLGLQEFMSAIDHASGNRRYIEDIPDFENPILGENRLSSVNKEEMHQVAKTQFKPLMSAVAKLSGNGKESGELYDYMFAKHGLERDAVMRQREAQKEFDKYQKANPKGTKTIGDFVASLEGKDYAGLTALTAEDGRVKSIQSQIDAIDEQMEVTDNQLLLHYLGGQKKRLKVDLLNAARDAADDIRKAFESNPSHDRSDINELWSRVNEVNGNTLRKLYESGMLTKEAYNDISSMYTNYIPMRGFDQTTSADAYAYLTHGDSAFNAPIKTAKGRSSKADNPIAYMQAMAESAIMQGNRNVLVKQKMLNFVRNHPSDLASVSDVWLQYDSVADEWKPVFPDNIGANDSASVVAKKMEAFEDKMKQMAEKHPNLVKRSNEAPDIPYKVVEKGQLNEHQVLVRQNGKSYIITVNGSPRAAQAANGLTNPDTDLTGAVGKVFEGAEALNRQLSSFYTTLNPDFIGSNYVRDALYSNTMVYVKEGAKYGGSFNLNFAKYNPAEMANLYARYNKGSLDTSNETHRLFLEFMQNGGETGFVNLKQIEKRKSEIAKAIKREGKISAAQIWGGASDAIDFANRAVENSARFAAYVTSRRSGRSVGRSVYDAKEISVNFNRKGSGSKFMGAEGQTKAGNAAAFVSGAGRGLYIFWNAGIQGLTNFSRQIGRHPGRALTLASLLFGFGALMSYLGSNDDDDENNYFNLPKYIRRSNVCYKIGDLFVTIPLPVEYRAFYGLGELASSTLAGKEDGTTKDIAKEAVSQVSQLFPIDFAEGGGGLHALIPSAVKPIVEAETNTAWTGLPIYKDNDFNKNMPEYTKVYKTANGHLVEIARALNDATGGNKYKKGFIDINPAKMEYVLKGILGGAFSFPDKLVKTTETIMGDREFDWRNTPFANRFVKNADERTEYKSLNEQYFKLKDEMDVVKQQLKGFEKEADAGNEKYEKALLQLEDSKDYERLELFKDYEKEFKGLNDELKELRMSPDYNKAEEKELQKEIAELQRQLIDEMREIKK